MQRRCVLRSRDLGRGRSRYITWAVAAFALVHPIPLERSSSTLIKGLIRSRSNCQLQNIPSVALVLAGAPSSCTGRRRSLWYIHTTSKVQRTRSFSSVPQLLPSAPRPQKVQARTQNARLPASMEGVTCGRPHNLIGTLSSINRSISRSHRHEPLLGNRRRETTPTDFQARATDTPPHHTATVGGRRLAKSRRRVLGGCLVSPISMHLDTQESNRIH